MQTKQKIRNYLVKNRQATGKELSDYLGITDRAVRKQLSSLIDMGELGKKGIPPKVYYYLTSGTPKQSVYTVDKRLLGIVEKNYLTITPSGKRLDGVVGFEYWCSKTNQPFEKTIEEYVAMQRKFDSYKMKDGLIHGSAKLRRTFDPVYLDELYYLDFYSIDRFGKTKLGQLILFGKQSQNKELMAEIVQIIRPRIIDLIKKFKITTIGFIPPTVKRQVQLMVELQKRLKIKSRELLIEKVKSKMLVPQKTLSKLPERIENARETMIVRSEDLSGNILLIDDAVGSGATLNETAKQIRERGMVKGKIIGLALVGSYKGFDVISEV